MDDLRNRYCTLNKSFKKKFVFHLGVEAGFFSEYNNMILAMLYCLSNKIQFVLYSKDANFGYDKGWNDYFLPFCDEDSSKFHEKYNFRNHEYLQKRLTKKDQLKIKYYKLFNGIDYLTQDLWLDIRNRELEKKTFHIPELGINGDLRSACKVLISLTWRYNTETECMTKQMTESLNIAKEYIGFHIRRGDKAIESDFIDINTYLDKIKDNTEIRNGYISTDDYTVFEILSEKYPDWKFVTLCTPSERGYFQEKQNKSTEDKKQSAISLFSSIDMLALSNIFVGTYSSNIGMYMGMRKEQDKCISVDVENWQIW